MNGQTKETALKEMSCNSSNFGLACHLSNDIRERKYSVKAVSVEGTAWTMSKDTQYLSNFRSSEKPTFQFGKLAGESPIFPTMSH